jgi:amino acid adenylation domain-containing protein
MKDQQQSLAIVLARETGVATLVELLRLRAEEQPEKWAYSFLTDGEDEQIRLGYAELDRRARSIAARLQERVRPGDRVLLILPSDLEFVAAFFGCLYAGAVAVPAYPPRSQRSLPRLLTIIGDATPTVTLTTSAILSRSGSWTSETAALRDLRWLAIDDPAAEPVSDLAGRWRDPGPDPDGLAFLQYTSGSTAAPKGVMVSHRNLLHNQEAIRRAFGQSESSVIVGWLPLFHDMGLIGNVLQPLYVGAPCVLMSPAAFLQKPLRWLRAIDRYRATTSGGPDFAYELCRRKISPEQRAGLDLSCWQVAFNGAEPVRAETLDGFAAAFAPHGFRREAFYPCYGLAEATLFVSGGEVGRGPAVGRFAAASLAEGRGEEAGDGAAERRLVGCGRAWMEQRIAIVDPETRTELPPGWVGEIWVAGPSVTAGYWNQPEATARDFGTRLAGAAAEGFLRTGDLGFLSGGELFVTGRLKDLIVLRGRNHYPQDFEATAVASHPDLLPGGVAAFSVEAEGEERLVILAEVNRRREAAVDVEAVAGALRQAIAEVHEVGIHEVVLIRAGTLLKTSSGKVRRRACRESFLTGALEVVGRIAVPPSISGIVAAEAPLDRRALLALKPEDRLATLAAHLRSEVARITHVTAGQIDPARPLVRQGLDSLAALELQQRLEEKLGVSLVPGALLDSGSIEELAMDLLSRSGESAGAAPLEPPLSASEPVDFPLSDGQKALWFLHRLAPESAAYNIAGAARVRGELWTGALRRSLVALVARHSALRTTFHPGDPEPRQRVGERPEIDFVEVDAAAWTDAELAARLDEVAWRPFALATGPLLRLAVFSRSREDHVLVLAVHHVVADLWSMAVLVRELGALYAEETGGAPATLAPLAATFADHVLRQRKQVDGPEGERSWAYWRERLGGPLPVLELPTDRPRPPLQTYAGAAVRLPLGEELSGRIAALARSRNTTLYTCLLAAFQVLLHRYTGQEDLLVGSPTAGRSTSALANVVGYFVNLLVLRAEVAGDRPFEALLEAVRRTVLTAFEHQDFPFLRLAERLQPERDPGRSPLFQAVFTLQRSPRPEEQALAAFAVGLPGARLAVGGLVLESLPLAERSSQFDLGLTVAELPGELVASLRYNTDLFDAATMHRALGHLRILLAGLTDEPARRVGDLPLLSLEEERQLLGVPARLYPVAGCLHRRFEEQVDRRPGAVALVCGEDSLTYGELNARANRLARHLASLGIGPEALVGIYLERSLDLVVAILGVLKAGGAYVPLERANPRERLELQLADSGARAVVTREELAGALPELGLPRVCLDRDEALLAARSPANLPGGVETESLAYVIYTSGSTGRPKGVAVTHANVVRLFGALEERFGFGPSEVWTLFHSYAFDFSVWELWGALLHGGRLVVVPYWVSRSPESFHELLVAQRVTVLSQTPSAFRQLIRAEEESGSPGDLSLRWVVFGGEALEYASLRPWLSRHGEDSPCLINMYGITETTVHVTYRRVLGREILAGAGSEIGEPLGDLKIYVLDRNQRLAPQGVAGELCVGGPGLARGYLGRPELTAGRFVPDPYSPRGGERLYRSGDLARHLPGGGLEYLGRIDQQVKIRGFRIELGEIESALAGHDAVRESAVVAHRGSSGEALLVAYVACAGARPSAGELRAFLSASLPEYMVPSTFVTLPVLPLTPNGKVDRRALPPPDVPEAAEPAAPRTATEELLLTLWVDVLGLLRAGVHDNFFDLGGHSLLATRIASRIRQVFGVELPLQRLFELPTVLGLAGFIDDAIRGGDEGGRARPEAPPQAGPRPRELPLSHGQERLWFLQQLAAGSPVLNIANAFRLAGSLDAGALAAGLAEIRRRHEILRSRMYEIDGAPRQEVLAPRPEPLPIVDLGGLRAPERELQRLADAEAALAFDLSAGRPLRALLLRLGEREHVLTLTVHHLAVDGWSLEILLRELAELYEACVQSRFPRLPALSLQYADYVLWQRRWPDEAVDHQLAFWRRQLAAAPPAPSLPGQREGAATPRFRGAVHRFELSPELSEALRKLSRAEVSTPFMTLLAAFYALLHQYTGQTDLLIGTNVANRNVEEIEGLIGYFVNNLALRADLSGEPTFRQLLGRVREMTLAAHAHQDVPFERVLAAVQPQRYGSYAPLFKVMFVMQSSLPMVWGLSGLETSRFELGHHTANFDLMVLMAEGADRLLGALVFDTDLFAEDAVARMGAHFEALLASVAGDPDQTLSGLDIDGDSTAVLLADQFNEELAL